MWFKNKSNNIVLVLRNRKRAQVPPGGVVSLSGNDLDLSRPNMDGMVEINSEEAYADLAAQAGSLQVGSVAIETHVETPVEKPAEVPAEIPTESSVAVEVDSPVTVEVQAETPVEPVVEETPSEEPVVEVKQEEPAKQKQGKKGK